MLKVKQFRVIVLVLSIILNVTITAERSAAQIVRETISSESGGVGLISGHQWVDLGLSVKWATCNVGASSESDNGSYFAWGEVTPKSEYTWSNLKYCLDNSGEKFSKYVMGRDYGRIDNMTVLGLSDDAARYNWGGSWRMPTVYEMVELLNMCKWRWTTKGGHNGFLVTGPSGRSIFLPAAGGIRNGNSSAVRVGSCGYYWTSSLYLIHSPDAYGLHFDFGYEACGCTDRRIGQTIRPVTE